MSSTMQALTLLMPSVPLLVVYLIGIIFSAFKLAQYRRAATLGIGGFGFLLVGRAVSAGGNLMTLPAYRGSMPIAELAGRIAMLNLLATVLVLAGTILLMLAIFADRDRKPSAP